MPQITLTIPDDLDRRLRLEAKGLGKQPETHILDILNRSIATEQNLQPTTFEQGLRDLATYLARIPSLKIISTSVPTEPVWWVKFDIDITHPLAWQVVQELGHVLNYLSLNEQLPTVFKPVSPPPYINGGPESFLSWVIEALLPFVDAGYVAQMLEGRLPRPVENLSQWQMDDDEA